MGIDKRYVEYGGRTFSEIAIERLKRVADEVIVVTAEDEEIEFYGVASVNDISSGRGPMMGIYTGLKTMTKPRGIVNPVDTPDLNADLLEYMKEISRGFDVVMPVWNNTPEPLIAIYSRNVIPVIDRFFKEGRKPAPRSLAAENNGLKVRLIGESELAMFGDPERMLRNMNKPEDLTTRNSQL
ncbi:MAG: molybdenum cofactor guanylyltransferase [Candidatus Dadabacteria bacterium]|nr:molybdenum cofactor guanylyltransferase [Candidatus Dadabacteria bacterium]